MIYGRGLWIVVVAVDVLFLVKEFGSLWHEGHMK
jgi:hypothetical protein